MVVRVVWGGLSSFLTLNCNLLFVALFSLCHSKAPALSFFSLVFLFPCFLLAVDFLGLLVCVSAHFPGFLRARKVRKFLGVVEVFLGIFKKTKKKGQGVPIMGHEWPHFLETSFKIENSDLPCGPVAVHSLIQKIEGLSVICRI